MNGAIERFARAVAVSRMRGVSMKGMATAMIIGRLVKDPEERQAGDYRVARLTLASNKKTGKEHDKDGRNVAYFDCEAWSGSEGTGGLYQVVMEHCGKGDAIAVSGDLWQDRWEHKDYDMLCSAVKLTIRGISLLGSPSGTKKPDPPKKGGKKTPPPRRKPAPETAIAVPDSDGEVPY